MSDINHNCNSGEDKEETEKVFEHFLPQEITLFTKLQIPGVKQTFVPIA